LRKETVRKIANHTLSQSVPPNVITTINGYTKIFVGELIEKARTVQDEWAEAADQAAIAEAEAKAAAGAAKTSAANTNTGNSQTPVPIPTSAPIPTMNPGFNLTTPAGLSLANSQLPANKTFELPPNPHRGPLLPSHLREAFRRYKLDGEGGGVGFSGLSLNGLGIKGSATWSVRGVGGRSLFR
jgi:transcription initiation factor TFIID subunit 11